MYAGAGGYTLRSLLSLQAALLARGDEVSFDIEQGGSLIAKVRNRIVKRFMDTNSDVLLFIDADMVFDAADILKIIDSQAPLTAIPYLNRKVGKAWNCALSKDDEGQPIALRVEGEIWVKADAAGTGLMAIKRECFGKMAAHYGCTQYEDNGPVLGLFDCAIIDGHYYGEDYLFCKRWLNIGGELWLLADATTGHVGETVYTGNLCTSLGGAQ